MTALPFPRSVLLQHVIALGKTRSGKSSKLRLIVEDLLKRREPVCVIDPKGDWWGLKSSASGKRAGFPVVIFGGAHADVPIAADAGAAVAELIATGNRPCIIDVGEFTVGERTRFFIAFAEMFFKRTRGRRYLLIDEVHNFAPKGKIASPEAGRMLHWANRLASEVAGKGAIVIAASQRPQKVHNDFLTSCETLIACRVIHKADRGAIKDWIDGCADPEAGRQVITELAGMERTEAWVWSPEIGFGPKRVAFPMFSTFDSFKPQEARRGRLKGWAAVDLAEVSAKLASVVQEAQAKDPAVLRRRITELERALEAARRKAPGQEGGAAARPSEQALAAERSRGYEAGVRATRREVTVRLKAARAGLIHGLEPRQAEIVEAVVKGFRGLGTLFRGMIEGIIDEGASTAAEVPPPARPAVPGRSRSAPAGPGLPAAKSSPADSSEAPLPRGEAAILAACIQYPDGLRREQLTALTGYKRSSRDAYIQRLSVRGYVSPSGDRIVVTPGGRRAAPDAKPLPTGEALQNYWFERLPEGERVILKVLVARHPKAISRDDLSEEIPYKRSSRDAYLQRLAAKQLIAEPSRGVVCASDVLFGEVY